MIEKNLLANKFKQICEDVRAEDDNLCEQEKLNKKGDLYAFVYKLAEGPASRGEGGVCVEFSELPKDIRVKTINNFLIEQGFTLSPVDSERFYLSWE